MMERAEQIANLKYRLEEEQRIDANAYPNNRVVRLKKEIELLELGCFIKDHINGILVNDKYIVAVRNSRWCVKGKNKWYWYKTLEHFVCNYIKRDELSKPVPSREG